MPLKATSVRLDTETLTRVGQMADAMDRPRAWLMAEAIKQYVAREDWFIREVPEIGRGIAAGYPDYPWWFGCDSEYALKGYLSIGSFDLVTSNINLISSLSNNLISQLLIFCTSNA